MLRYMNTGIYECQQQQRRRAYHAIHSFRWLAPELLTGDRATAASDVYAFGMWQSVQMAKCTAPCSHKVTVTTLSTPTGLCMWELLMLAIPFAGLHFGQITLQVPRDGLRPQLPDDPSEIPGGPHLLGVEAYVTLLRRCCTMCMRWVYCASHMHGKSKKKAWRDSVMFLHRAPRPWHASQLCNSVDVAAGTCGGHSTSTACCTGKAGINERPGFFTIPCKTINDIILSQSLLICASRCVCVEENTMTMPLRVSGDHHNSV